MKNIFTKLMYVGVMLILTLTFANNELKAQCFASFPYGATTAPTVVGQTNTLTPTCAFGNEYGTITGATAGHMYQFTATASAPVYVTVTQGTPTGTVLVHGFSPVEATPTVSGNLYMHYHSSAACATTGLGCVNGSITLLSTAPPCNYDVPANIVVNNSPGLCGAVVNFTVGQGNCPDPPIVEPPSGSFFPVGTTTVGVGTGTGGYEEFTVTVNDTEPPTLSCPSNMNITLNPGECNRIINYTVGADDNCPFIQMGPTLQFPESFAVHGGGLGTGYTLSGNNFPGGLFFNLTNTGTDQLIITGFGIRFGNPAFGMVNPPQTMQIYTAPTYIGNETNAGAWTNVGPAVVNPIPPFIVTGTGDLGQAELTTDVDLAPGETKGFFIFGETACPVFNWNGGAAIPPVVNAPLTLTPGSISFGQFGPMFQTGAVATPNIQVNTLIGGGGDVVQTSGLPSGSTFDIGTVTNCFELEDGAGNTGDCCFDITVSEFPNPTLALVCNNLVNISVDENCEALLNADMILEGGPYKCYDDYIITVNTLSGLPVGNPVSGLYAGQTLVVSVEDPDTGNSCWGYIKVEDKLKPVIECRDVIIDCNDELPTVPAPGIDGPQSIIYEGLNDIVGVPNNPAMVEYEFDFNYLPVDATVQNVGVRIKVQHTWAADLIISIEAPDGTSATVFNVSGGGGCLAANITIDVTFDDNGIDVGNCTGLNLGGALVRPMMGAAAHFNALETFDGIDARGTWKVTYTDNIFGDEGLIDIAGIILSVDAPTIDPFDNCGLASVVFSDEVEPGDCDDEFASVVTRTWVATDLSGNQGTCVQTISIERGDLEDYVAPPTWYADCSDNFLKDAHGNPHPSVSGSPLSDACKNIVGTYTDVRINDACGGYKIIRTWSLIDWCTLETVKLTQLLKVLNEEAPEFVNCPPPGTVVNVSTRFNDCVGDYIAQQLTAINNCTGQPITNIVVTASAGTVVWNQQIQRYQVLNLPVGQHTITYSANDGCDNIAQCTYILNVIDNVPPIAICDERTRVSLGSNGEAFVHVSAWDDGSYDNCGIASILAYRKGIRHLFPAATTPCHQGNQNPDRNDPRPQIKFCCADIGEVEIVVEVTDVSGNMNICWVTVEIEDKLPPVVQCPPNVVIDCRYEFDFPLGQLSDAELNATFDAEFGGPLAVDNCNLIFQDWIIQFDLYNSQCRIGTPVPPVVNPPMAPYTAYRRVFIAEDAGGNQASCIQDIVILPNFDNPFIGDDLPWPQGDIRWPEDETVGSCLSADDDALSPDALNSKPFMREKGCAKPVAGYQDQIFTFVDDACFKILRTWTVIDWCNHNPNTGQGEWSHVQVINVMDDGPATCNNCEDQVFVDSTSSDCTGFADLVLDVSDCTPEDMLQVSWRIDIFQTGVFDIFGNGLNASGNYPFGEHTIRWTVYDLCSNVAVFEYDFEVVDGKLPSPVCLNGIATVVMPVSGDITIPAAFFDVASFDNCTKSEDLIFTYSSDVTHLTETWSCEDLDGTNEQTFEVQIWVTDEAGNQDFCVTYILIQDNNNICPDTAGGSAAISGFIVNELYEGVENVVVSINGVNNNFLSTDISDSNGAFDINVFVGQNYAASGQRTDNPLNGVTTFDIALIQRHILGTQFLNTPYKLIAADVNNDNKINVLDIAELRRVILGTYSEFPNNDSWKIIVDEPLQMGLTPPAHETVLDLGYVVRDMEETNFIGVKIGDVNASHNASGLISSSERSLVEDLRLQTEDRQIKAGEQVVMEITSDNIDGVFGYQGTINFDASVLEFINYEAGVIGLSDANFGFHLMSEGMVTTSWSEVEAVSGSNGQVLFALIFEAKQDGTLSDLVAFTSTRTASESYNERGVMGVEMVFGNRVSTTDFALYQNSPNPFNGQTVIGFVLPEATEATMTIYDVTGKVVRVIEGDYTAGYNELTLERRDVGSAGVYYYQLDTDNHRATKKMIFMD